MSDEIETIDKNPKSWAAWKREAERLQAIIDNMRERLAALENYAEAEAVGADRAAEDGVYWMKRCKELESRTITDWIEHDGKWRPESLGLDELVYLKTRKQELKIPYPAGKVKGWMNTGGDMDVMAYKLASPQARTVTVKLPPELYTIGELIRTQDNRITDQPMFVVFQKREIIGSDEHSPSRICWVWDGEEVSELRAKRLEALYQDGRDTRGYDRYAMQEVDEFVTACFTEHGCKDYLRQNGHNLRLPYIYACGSFRNNEYQLVRNWLAGIKVEAE